MPMYKNRVPMDPASELRRYTTLNALVDMLRNRRLRLTRLDTFQDPFEGSVPKRQIDDQVPIFSSRNAAQMMSVAAHYPSMRMPPRRSLDPWTEMTLRRRAKTRSAHASCWTAGHESEAMGGCTAGMVGRKAKASPCEAPWEKLRQPSRATIYL